MTLNRFAIISSESPRTTLCVRGKDCGPVWSLVDGAGVGAPADGATVEECGVAVEGVGGVTDDGVLEGVVDVCSAAFVAVGAETGLTGEGSGARSAGVFVAADPLETGRCDSGPDAGVVETTGFSPTSGNAGVVAVTDGGAGARAGALDVDAGGWAPFATGGASDDTDVFTSPGTASTAGFDEGAAVTATHGVAFAADDGNGAVVVGDDEPGLEGARIFAAERASVTTGFEVVAVESGARTGFVCGGGAKSSAVGASCRAAVDGLASPGTAATAAFEVGAVDCCTGETDGVVAGGEKVPATGETCANVAGVAAPVGVALPTGFAVASIVGLP